MKIENKLFKGNCLDVLKKFPDNSVDSICSDPPYGLGTVKDLPSLLTSWMNNESGDEFVGKNGFMGKEWDKSVPPPAVWKECLRVLKPGGHMLCFAGTRTVDLMSISTRLAGFELRDQLYWHYGSGFPKNMDISKKIDQIKGKEGNWIQQDHEGRKGKRKRNNSNIQQTNHSTKNNEDGLRHVYECESDEGKHWSGWGTALKPATEPILLLRKPIEEKTIAENVLKHGTGAINIDESRIKSEPIPTFNSNETGRFFNRKDSTKVKRTGETTTQGRWPANVILTHHPDCEHIGYKKVKGVKAGTRKAGTELGQNSDWNKHENKDTVRKGIGDKYGNETIENWECVDGCPIKMMDEQSGISKSSGGSGEKSGGNLGGFGFKGLNKISASNHGGLGDVGGASRFFYVAKPSKAEKNKGLENFKTKNVNDGRKTSIDNAYQRGDTQRQNTHPTVKPITLMEYLVKLITPKGGICLDPFCGSGSTPIACKKLDYKYVGIDMEQEYLDISKARLKTVKKNKLNGMMLI